MSENIKPISRARRIARIAARVGGWVLLIVATIAAFAWSTIAVCYAALPTTSPRIYLAAIYAAALLASLFALRPRMYRWPAFGVLFAIVLVWFLTLKPSNDRNWLDEVERTAWADINGDSVLVHNVRNFDYRSETEFTPTWEERTYNLKQVCSIDYILVYWGSPAIAHAIVSFGFDDGRFLAISIETRKERHESYSSLQGFFRQYELIYVCADERDAIRVRTNYRNEQVYLYRTRAPRSHARAILLSYLARMNSLRDEPDFYNALTTNCTTSIVTHARAGTPTAHVSWDILLSGYSARHAYRNGNLDTSMPFETLQARSHVNAVALAADRDPDFSHTIRKALPMPLPRAEGTP